MLSSVMPNPVREGARIMLQLGSRSAADFYVVDILGRRVESIMTTVMEAGDHVVLWRPPNGTPSGEYAIVLEANGRRLSRRYTLVR